MLQNNLERGRGGGKVTGPWKPKFNFAPAHDRVSSIYAGNCGCLVCVTHLKVLFVLKFTNYTFKLTSSILS